MANIDPDLGVRIAQDVEAAYAAIEEKGSTLPENKNLDNLAATITAIPSGIASYGTVTTTTGKTLTIRSLEEFLSMAEPKTSYTVTVDGQNFLNTQIATVSLHQNITAVPDYFCYYSNSITAFSAPGAVKIGTSVGYGWTSFSGTLNLPEVIEVGDSFMRGTSVSNRITISQFNMPKLSVTGSYFCAYTNFTSQVEMPTLSSIGDYFLAYSTFNSPITLPTGITTLPNYFMTDCTSFNYPIVVPSNITIINQYFMQNCTSFNSPLTIGQNVMQISNSFLSGCTSFNQTLIIPSSVRSIQSYFMYKCNNFQQYVDFGSLSYSSVNSSTQSFATDDSTALVYTQGFKIWVSGSWSNWRSRFGDRSSSPYRKLIQFNPDYITAGGTKYVLANASDIVALCNAGENITLSTGTVKRNQITQVTITTQITEIPSGFCANFTSLTSLTLPTTFTQVGDDFLKGCTSFNQKITLTNVTTIGDNFLYGCTAFNQALVFPSGMTEIGDNFLYGCTAYNQEISIPDSVQSVGTAFMFGCDNFEATLCLNKLEATVFQVGTAEQENKTFATTNSSASIYTTGFKIVGFNYDDFAIRFANRDESPYRKILKGYFDYIRKVNGDIQRIVGTDWNKLADWVNPVPMVYGSVNKADVQWVHLETPGITYRQDFCSGSNYSSLEGFDFPEGFSSFENRMLSSLPALTHFTFPSTITSVNAPILSECENLVEVTVGDLDPNVIFANLQTSFREEIFENTNKPECASYVNGVKLYGSKAAAWKTFFPARPAAFHENNYRKLLAGVRDYIVLTDDTRVDVGFDNEFSNLLNAGSPSSSITLNGETFTANQVREVHLFDRDRVDSGFCRNFTSLTVLDINLPTGTTTFGTAYGFLENCTSFNQALPPVSANGGFLKGCTSFNKPLTVYYNYTSGTYSPDHFMSGCTAFNSPITFTGGLHQPMNYFMYNCSSFNQPIDLSTINSSIGNNAFCGWTSFNQNIDISGMGMPMSYTVFRGLDSFTSEITAPSAGNWHGATESCFSSSNSEAPIYTTGFKFVGPNSEGFASKFPTRASNNIYRTVSYEVWPSAITISVQSLEVGDNESNWFTVTPSNAAPLVFTSSDPTVASIDSNRVLHGLAAGTTTLTISCPKNGLSATQQITVTAPTGTQYGILKYHSEWTDQWDCYGQGVTSSQIVDETTLSNFISTNHIQSEGGGGMGGDYYRSYYQEEWDPETGEPTGGNWVFYTNTGEVRVAPENMVSTTGISVELDEYSYGMAELDITHMIEVDYNSQVTEATLSSLAEYQALAWCPQGTDWTNCYPPSTISAGGNTIPTSAIVGYTFGTVPTSVGNGFLTNLSGYGDEHLEINTTLASGITSIGSGFLAQTYGLNNALSFPNVTTIGDGFLYSCWSFNSPITLGSVTTIGNSFLSGCQEFNQPLDLSTVQTIGSGFLNSCSNFNQVVDVTNITFSTDNFLNGCQSLENNNIRGIHFGTVIGNNFLSETGFNQAIDTSQVTEFGSNFLSSTAFNQPLSLASATTIKSNFLNTCRDFNQPLDISGVTSLGQSFLRNCSSFNQDLTWNGTAVPSNFLEGCSNFNGNLSFPNATSVGGYFLWYCKKYDKWPNMPNVTTVGTYFMSGCSIFNQPLAGTGITTVGTYFLNSCAAFNNTLPPITVVPANFLNNCSSFNRPIDFTQFTSIGSDFLKNCSSFDQTIDFSQVTYTPPTIKGLPAWNSPYIFKNGIDSVGTIISECNSFNQPLVLPATVTKLTGSILWSCPSWNQDFTFPAGVKMQYNGDYFRSCDGMTSTFYFETNQFPSYGDSYSFCTQSATSACYVTGIKFGGTYASAALSRWATRNSMPYRKTMLAS